MSPQRQLHHYSRANARVLPLSSFELLSGCEIVTLQHTAPSQLCALDPMIQSGRGSYSACLHVLLRSSATCVAYPCNPVSFHHNSRVCFTFAYETYMDTDTCSSHTPPHFYKLSFIFQLTGRVVVKRIVQPLLKLSQLSSQLSSHFIPQKLLFFLYMKPFFASLITIK